MSNEKAGGEVAVIILIIIVVIASVIFFNKSLQKGILGLIGIDIPLSEEEKILMENVENSFADLNVNLNECSKNSDNECFCVKGGYIYPAGYHLKTYRSGKDINLELTGGKNEFIAKKVIKDAQGCVLVKKLNTVFPLDEGVNDFDRPDILFKGNPTLSFKRQEFIVNPSLLFYKKEGRICIIDKDYAETVSYKRVCISEEKKNEIEALSNSGTSASLIKVADIYREIGEYEKAIINYLDIAKNFDDSNSERAKDTLDILLKDKFKEFVINKETNSGLIDSIWIKGNMFVTRLENPLGNINDLKEQGWNDDEIYVYENAMQAEGGRIWNEYYKIYNEPENKEYGLNFYTSEKDFLNEYILGKALVPKYRLKEITTQLRKIENPLSAS